MKKSFKGFCLASFLLIAVFGCNNSNKNEPHPVQAHKISTNENALKKTADATLRAPDFTLTGMDGKEFRLSNQIGKVVVLNFWATWCGPCIKELPDFIELQKELAGQDVLFVGISVEQERWEMIRPFAKEHGINYKLLRDDGTFFEKYGPMAIPRTFIINHRGELAHIIKTSTTKKLLKPLLTDLGALAKND